jgi:ribokinase
MSTTARPTPHETGAAASVVVVGAINVDLVIAADRLPAPGETVVGPGVEQHGGGKGANASVAASRSGAAVSLIGAVGADDTGTGALTSLIADGVDVSGVARLDGTPTGVAFIVVDPHGENLIAVGAGANAAVTVDHVEAAADRLRSAGCVLVSTEIPVEAVGAAVRIATSAGVPCILNTAPVVPGLLELLPLGPIVTPNRGELADLATGLGITADPDDHVAMAQAVVAVTGAPVVVTLGGDGALAVSADGVATAVAARPATVRDTTGAGDTFNGVLAAGLAAGSSLDDAVRRAIVAASLSVEAVGAREGMPHADAIDAAVS